MTTPVSGVALDSESVKLLRAGDVLRQEDGKEFTFRCECTEPGNLYLQEGIFWPQRAETFSFAFRPDVPALTDGEGARERLLADLDALCDGELNSTPVRTWGDSGDGAYVRYIGDIGRDLRALLNGADR